MTSCSLGQYFRGCTESCLFGVRGMCEYRTLPDGKRARAALASTRRDSSTPQNRRSSFSREDRSDWSQRAATMMARIGKEGLWANPRWTDLDEFPEVRA